MRFSVVTISYNQGDYLRRCIDSVLSQKGVEVEYIIVDAGSTDDSRAIIADYGAQFARVILEPDNGPADGLNKGFALATGDILYYLNSDDEVLPEAFRKAAEVFVRYPDVDVVFGDGFEIDKEGQRRAIIYASPRYSLYGQLCGGISFLQQATFIRSSAFLKAGGFNVANRTCWDGELLLDLARTGAKFRHISELLGAFRIHDQSLTGSQRLQDEYLKYWNALFKRFMGRDPSAFDDLAKAAYWSVRKITVAMRARKYRQELTSV